MGIIKHGSVSGNLPSTSEAFAVNYPGYPSSIERAVETLGGNEGIIKARSEKSNKLELHFRPEDPYSHPAFGELKPCNNFLLRISKKKVKDAPINSLDKSSKQNNLISESAESTRHVVRPECESSLGFSEVDDQKKDAPQEQIQADIVSRVSEAYHFNGMVDYQHVLPVHADAARRKKRNWAEVEPEFEKRGLMDVDQNDLMILVPPLFSIKDIPEKIVLKLSTDQSSKKKQEVVQPDQPHGEMEIEQCLAIDFNIKEIPKKVHWEKAIPRDSDLWQWQMAVCELFDQRPIWVKSSLAEHLLDRGLNIGNNVLRRLLFLAAYYFSNGPYRRFWIKKGYDPRKDPESRIYQNVDFRVPPSLRSYCDRNATSELKQRWEDICAFRVFPYKAQISLQVFELMDEYIQREIRKPASQGDCNLHSGWFSSHLVDSLRLCISKRFLLVYPETGAESLLKSISKRFEKSKRALLNLKDAKAGGERKKSDKDVENKETTNDEPEQEEEEVEEGEEEDDYDDEEEEDIEDDNLQEDIDAAEALHPGGHDRDFALQPDLYTDKENISKDYLQELFGSFPFNGTTAGDGLLPDIELDGDVDDDDDDAGDDDDDDDDDGGYQIYEHYSDDEDDEDY